MHTRTHAHTQLDTPYLRQSLQVSLCYLSLALVEQSHHVDPHMCESIGRCQEGEELELLCLVVQYLCLWCTAGVQEYARVCKKNLQEFTERVCKEFVCKS